MLQGPITPVSLEINAGVFFCYSAAETKKGHSIKFPVHALVTARAWYVLCRGFRPLILDANTNLIQTDEPHRETERRKHLMSACILLPAIRTKLFSSQRHLFLNSDSF